MKEFKPEWGAGPFFLTLFAVLFIWGAGNLALGAMGPNWILEVDSNGVHIEGKDILLKDVLQKIERSSGIRFHFSEETGLEKINFKFAAPSWRDLIKILLDNYGTLSSWGPEKSQVWVLKRRDLGFRNNKIGSNIGSEINLDENKPDIEALKIPEEWILRLHPIENGNVLPPPPSIQNDPLAHYFWEEFGVELPYKRVSEHHNSPAK